MSEDVRFLHDTFDNYEQRAKIAHANGNYALAQRNYKLAALTMFKIAKVSPPALRQERANRAKRLLEIADNLNSNNHSNLSRVQYKPSTNNKNKFSSDNQQSNEELVGEGKQWQGAQIPDIHFSDIAGLEDVKRSITVRMINPVKYPEKYAKYGKKSGGGVLLYGPPGTGKTMIAKAIACEVGATFYAIKGSDILSKWVGESEQNINSLFEAAQNDDLAIIFIDEMDSLFGQRGLDVHNDKRVNEFLQQIDGFSSKMDNILLLGATNKPWLIDSAAVRSGRFSEKIYVTLPDEKARDFMLKKNLKNVPIDKDIDWDKLVKFTKGYSGADIAEVCDRAKEEPLNKYIETDVITNISMVNILQAIKSVKPTVSEKELKEYDLYAGVNKIDENLKKKIKEEENKVLVTFVNSTITLYPDVKPIIEFTLSKDEDKVYINVDGKNYLCTKKLGGFVSEELQISKPGVYEVIISTNKEIAREKIKFVKGLEEDDLGL